MLSFFHFVVLTKTSIGSAYVTINKIFISANLMHDRIVIVENTRVKFLPGASCKVIKLCLSVLNDESMVVHQICIYDTFQPW